MLRRNVYILDYELMSPIAAGADRLAAALETNFSAEHSITRMNASGLPFKKAAEIREDLSPFYRNEAGYIQDVCRYDRCLELLAACYGRSAGRLAPVIDLFAQERTGVILGIGAGVTPFELFEDKLDRYLANGQNPVSELFAEVNNNAIRLNLANNPYDVYAIYLANKFNAAEFQRSVLTACVSSTQALALAYESIANNESDVVVAGGTDSIINLLALISFGKMGVISETTPDVSCKPFDINRNGTLAGECAGFAVLVSEDFLKRHKLNPVAEFLGYGNTLDAYKITAPDPDGASITRAISNAVQHAGISPGMIDYINAHGTGTKQNDHLELSCIFNALGEAGKTIPISSTKDRHGHAIAAAGIQELCVLLEAMKNSRVPANLNLNTACDTSFNLVRENFSKRINYALTSNFAFGGVNTVLALKNELA
jgi:3-oxoacyl-[acyl-carrier-protein] synthase II